jgi:hypothetical protein
MLPVVALVAVLEALLPELLALVALAPSPYWLSSMAVVGFVAVEEGLIP